MLVVLVVVEVVALVEAAVVAVGRAGADLDKSVRLRPLLIKCL